MADDDEYTINAASYPNDSNLRDRKPRTDSTVRNKFMYLEKGDSSNNKEK